MEQTRGSSVLTWLRVHTWGHLVALSTLVGVVAGVGGWVFSTAQEGLSHAALGRAAGYVLPRAGAEGVAVASSPARPWLLLVIPAAGGLLAGVLIYTLAPEAEGHGTDSVINAFHRHRGIIRARVPLVKLAASVLTIGTGGSAGREGPIGQIGAGFGSALARWLRTGDRDRRLLMLAGAGAGIGAIFRAPLGGALFAAEVLYRSSEFESAALVPSFVAAIVAYSVYCGITGVWGPMFRVPVLQFSHPAELPFYVILGVACAAAGILYCRTFYWLRDAFQRLAIPNHVKPMLGGLAVGGIAVVFPAVLGMGYGWVQMGIDGTLPVRVMVSLLLLKMVATGFTIGSGGSGGVFAPSMVIGGLLGAAAGALFHRVAPGVVTNPTPFILVGMAGFFSGVAKVPVSSLVMVSEMTEGYGLLVPLMLATSVSFLLTPKSVSIYENQVDARVDSPAHRGEFYLNVLERLRVGDVLSAADHPPPVLFHRDAPVEEIAAAAADARQEIFPVVSADGSSVVGVVDLGDLALLMAIPHLAGGLVLAEDLCSRRFELVTADETLASALKKLRATGLEGLPVVATGSDGPVTGVINRRDIGNAYYDYVHHDGAT